MGHRLPPGVKLASTLGLAGALVLAARPARPQYAYTGPSKCIACHDHDRPASKWQKEEPAAYGVKAHFNTRKQLDGAKAAGFAKAIGLSDSYDLKGACVKCHATVFRGDANAGVSCESCHGPASGYLDAHQVKGSYLKSVGVGLKDLREKPASIARVCVECHVTPDKRLAAAGHPSGGAFDAGTNLRKIVHWARAYDYAQVSAAGKTAMGPRRASAAPSAPAAAPPKVAAAAASPAARAAVSAAPPLASAKPIGPSASLPPLRAASPAEPASSPPAPWDWDQPIRPLPKDYVPEPVAQASAEPAGATAEEVPGPGTVAPGPPAAPPRASRLVARPPAVPPSIAEEIALPRSLPGLAEPNAVTPAVQPAVAAQAGVRSAAAQVAELRGRGVALLERLLRSGARAPALSAPAKPAEFRGPDSELFRLQDEVIALALEALRRPR